MPTVSELLITFSTPLLNASDIRNAPTAPSCGEKGKPCEWPVLWTLFAAIVSALIFCLVQVILYFINDPGIKKQKPSAPYTSQGALSYEAPAVGDLLPAKELLPEPPATGVLHKVTAYSEVEEDRALGRAPTRSVTATADHGGRKLSLVAVRGIGMQHDLLPVEEEETTEVPDEVAQVAAPATPAKIIVSPPPFVHIRFPQSPSKERRRVVSESDTGAGTPPGDASAKAPPSTTTTTTTSDRLRSPRHSAATVTIAMLNSPENRQEAHQLRNTTTITATTGARHLKELQRNIRHASQTDMFLNAYLNRRAAIGTPDRRSHHGSGHSHAKQPGAGAGGGEQPHPSGAGLKNARLDPKQAAYHTWHPASPHARPRHVSASANKSSQPTALGKSEGQRERDDKSEPHSSSHLNFAQLLFSKLHLRTSATDQGVHNESMEARHAREKHGLTPGAHEPTFAGYPLAQARITASMDSPNAMAPFGIAPLGAGTPLSNGTSQHSAASDLHTQSGPDRAEPGKIFSVDDPEDPATPSTYRHPHPAFFATQSAAGGAPTTHKDDLSVPSRAIADLQLGVGQRANSSSSRFHPGILKRSGSHEPSTDRRASEALEMKEFPSK